MIVMTMLYTQRYPEQTPSRVSHMDQHRYDTSSTACITDFG